MSIVELASFSGVIAGYDPGGNNNHGLALLDYHDGLCKTSHFQTYQNAEDVISSILSLNRLDALGIDTLAAWSTGPSGWRPADRWLRSQYRLCLHSIVSPNGLYGSMGINGMSVLLEVRRAYPHVQITEAHPKVLYWALTGKKYAYDQTSQIMDQELSSLIGANVRTHTDHEWDAIASALAAYKGMLGAWKHDLFQEPMADDERLIYPAGHVNYWWPE